MHEINASICDPFDLIHNAPATAAKNLGLNYSGTSPFNNSNCLLVEAWKIDRIPNGTPNGSLIQWWIDRQSYRPALIKEYVVCGEKRTRFLYDAVNKPLPVEDFAIPNLKGISPTPPEPLDSGYTKRFIMLRDGSDGRVWVRWGKEGPKGDSSSGN